MKHPHPPSGPPLPNQTPDARIRRAVAVVAEQRNPDGEYGALGHPELGPVAGTIAEALALQELERLQRAVMGEPEPAV